MKSPAEFWQLLIYCSESARGSREDISTGGAVMGLLPHLQGNRHDAAGHWTVHQGFGLAHERGTIFTTLLEEPGVAAVGGRHRFVAQGVLL